MDDDDDFMQWYSQFGVGHESPCEGNTPGWVDSYGDGCEYYEIFDTPGCPEEGDLYEGPMGTARENCCYCSMTSAPSISTSPTLSPAPTMCTGSTPNFKDSFGDGCEYYEMFDAPGCPFSGHLFEGVMGVANDHCCYCMMSSSPTPSPPEIEGYEFKGHGFCASDDDNEDPFADHSDTIEEDPYVVEESSMSMSMPTASSDPFATGFDFIVSNSASTLEECASACAAEHSNDPLFRGFNWVDQFLCFCLKSLEGGAGAGEITGAVNEFGMGNNMQCYAYESVSTES